MTEEILIDELNELAECIMDSIDEYVNQKVIYELYELLDVLDGNLNKDLLRKRINELKQE